MILRRPWWPLGGYVVISILIVGLKLVIATSNVGAEVYREPAIGFMGTRRPEELITEADETVVRRFLEGHSPR